MPIDLSKPTPSLPPSPDSRVTLWSLTTTLYSHVFVFVFCSFALSVSALFFLSSCGHLMSYMLDSVFCSKMQVLKGQGQYLFWSVLIFNS